MSEGLAEYSGVVVAAADSATLHRLLAGRLAVLDTLSNLERVFAYEPGPAYGYFLDQLAAGGRGWLRGSDGLSRLLVSARGGGVPVGGGSCLPLRRDAPRGIHAGSAPEGPAVRAAQAVRDGAGARAAALRHEARLRPASGRVDGFAGDRVRKPQADRQVGRAAVRRVGRPDQLRLAPPDRPGPRRHRGEAPHRPGLGPGARAGVADRGGEQAGGLGGRGAVRRSSAIGHRLSADR